MWPEAEWTLLSDLQREHHGKLGSYGNSCLVDHHITNLPSFTLFPLPNFVLEWLVYSHFGRQLYAHRLCLLLGSKAMTNLDSILKSRDIILPTKVRLVKAMVFPVVMYGCESWTIKKAECQRIDAFELWHWRRCLRVPWTARRSNYPSWRTSVLNIHWKDWCWSWNSTTLATWCKELTHWKRSWCWERLRAGEEDDRGWDGWMA